MPRPVHRLGRFTSGLLVCARRSASRAWLSAALRDSTAAEAPGGVDPTGSSLAITGQEDGSGHTGRPGDPRLLEGWAAAAGPAPGAMAWRDRAVASARSDADGSRPTLRKLYRALLLPGVLDLEPGGVLEITTPIGRRPHPRLGTIWCAARAAQPGDLNARSVLTLLRRRPEADLVQVAIASGRPHQIRIHCAALGAPLLGDPLYRAGGQAESGALPGDGGYRLQAWRLELRRPDGERLVLQVPEGLGD